MIPTDKFSDNVFLFFFLNPDKLLEFSTQTTKRPWIHIVPMSKQKREGKITKDSSKEFIKKQRKF